MMLATTVLVTLPHFVRLRPVEALAARLLGTVLLMAVDAVAAAPLIEEGLDTAALVAPAELPASAT